MDYYGKKMSRLIEQLSALPGIGGKSAQRLAFHIIHMPKEQVEQLTDAIKDARENICYCKECYTLTDQELCPICANPVRSSRTRISSCLFIVTIIMMTNRSRRT